MSETCIRHIEKAWQLKTEASNKLFRKRKFEKSLSGYEEALCRAEVLNSHYKDAVETEIPFLQIFAISCNNIAYTYENMGLLEEGEIMLKRVIYYLLIQIKNEQLHTEMVGSELKRAMLNYSQYANRNGMEVKKAEKVFADIAKGFE